VKTWRGTSDSAKNVKFLETYIESWLAVLFNVFSSMERDNRGMVGDVISVWASIADRKVRAFQFFKSMP
jgi:ribosomal RNA-processing protein 12